MLLDKSQMIWQKNSRKTSMRQSCLLSFLCSKTLSLECRLMPVLPSQISLKEQTKKLLLITSTKEFLSSQIWSPMESQLSRRMLSLHWHLLLKPPKKSSSHISRTVSNFYAISLWIITKKNTNNSKVRLLKLSQSLVLLLELTALGNMLLLLSRQC